MPVTVIFESRKVDAQDGAELTPEGSRHYLIEGDWGVESRRIYKPGDGIETHEKLHTFRNQVAARAFMKKWEGQPWYVKPNGNFEILRVFPLFKRVQVGWKVKAIKSKS